MNTKRIEEIQRETAYPDSISVQQALLKVWNECEQEKAVKNNAVLPHVSNSGNPLMHAKCDKCGRQILSWKNCGIASMYKNYDKDNFEYTGNIEQWVCNYCTAELGYDVD
jgi:hypothetical protein